MTQAHFHVVIPARLASSRLSEKPLADIHGKPMIQWVYEQAIKSTAASVTIATDSEKIVHAVEKFGGNACLTRADHSNGTSRIVEVCEQKGWSDDTIIVNCQGDEPLLPHENIDQVAKLIQDKQSPMATLHKPISSSQADDPNTVKLVLDQQGKALYFSRSKIPYDRDGLQPSYLGHIGLYAYTVGFLRTYHRLMACELEQSEQLEQLRALYHGYDIYSAIAKITPGPGIDTPQDLNLVREVMANNAI